MADSLELPMDKDFNELLLGHIREKRNDKASAMLNKELALVFDDLNYYGTLLHYAVLQNNAVIVRKLIELGADVNRYGGCGSTPLMSAIMSEHQNATIMKILLEAGARLDIVDDYFDEDYIGGVSALQWGLNTTNKPGVCELLIRKLRTVASTNDEVAEMLIRTGCCMPHAATLRDVDLMECMLRRGVDVNSKNWLGMTAVHVAIDVMDVKLAVWLFKKGADVDVLDDTGCSALCKSVWLGHTTMVQALLKAGARVDLKGHFKDHPAIYTAFLRLQDAPDRFYEFIELFLHHGATLPDSDLLHSMFCIALDISCDKALKLLIAHMAMLEKLGKPVDKLFMKTMDVSYAKEILELQKYYESCQQILTIEVFEKLSLLDFLNTSDHDVTLMVHEVESVSSENKLSELYPYYYNSMKRHIEKANR